MDATAAAAELAALGEDRAALAERVVQPWWYDALLGLLVAGFLSSYATHDAWVICGALVLLLLGLRGLMAVYRRITGVWVNGLRPGPTQRAVRCGSRSTPWSSGVAACSSSCSTCAGRWSSAASCWVSRSRVISQWWTRIYVAELAGEL